MLSPAGVAQEVSGEDGKERLTTNVIPLASLTTDDVTGHNAAFIGNITGMSFLNGNLYAVTDTGQVYQILNYSNPGFTPVAATATAGATIAPVDMTVKPTPPTPPSLHWIGTIQTDGTSPANVAFAGLTVGPPDISEGQTPAATRLNRTRTCFLASRAPATFTLWA